MGDIVSHQRLIGYYLLPFMRSCPLRDVHLHREGVKSNSNSQRASDEVDKANTDAICGVEGD